MPPMHNLLSLKYENNPSSSRGIFIWNGFVFCIIRHYKVKWQTDREFHVARFLPARLGVVMFRYVVSMRRLADVLLREQAAWWLRTISGRTPELPSIPVTSQRVEPIPPQSYTPGRHLTRLGSWSQAATLSASCDWDYREARSWTLGAV
jgi:hypothetical protein